MLAVALYGHRGLTPEQFALNHPSGALGRRLTLRVSDVMHALDRVPSVGGSDTMLQVVTAISSGGLGAAVVLDASEQLLGIITDGDLRRSIERYGLARLEGVTAEEVMTRDPVTVSEDALVYQALQQMEDRASQISVLPVVDGGRCLGLVRVHDLVRAGV